MTFEHKEVAVSFQCLQMGETLMLRDRTWKERLLSGPWRPWVKQVATPYAQMLKARERAMEEMRQITGISSLLE